VLVEFTVPIYTAISRLTAFTLGYSPQLVVSSVGIGPPTLAGLLKVVSKDKVSGDALIDGAITDAYLPPFNDTANPWIQLFLKVRAQYDPGSRSTATSSTGWPTRDEGQSDHLIHGRPAGSRATSRHPHTHRDFGSFRADIHP
jgi:hypothetical protein